MNQDRPPQSAIQSDERFGRYYTRHLQPLEPLFERLRRSAVKNRNQRGVAATLAWLAALGSVGYLTHPLGEVGLLAIFFGLATGVGLGIWAWLPAGSHELRLKDHVLPRIVGFFGDLRYQAEPDLVPRLYADWMVLPHFSKARCRDQIEGSYQGVELKLAEVRLLWHHRSDSDTRSAVTFDGLMIDFRLRHEYPGVTLIRSQGSTMDGHYNLHADLVEVSHGSAFEVFSTRDAPGAQLADTEFLQRLAKVAARFGGRQLSAAFHGDRLVMLIEHESDYFELSHREKTDFARDAERIRDQLFRILAIVDTLHLSGHSAKEAHTGDPGVQQHAEIPWPSTEDPYDHGGYGCLHVFVLFAIAMSAYLCLLDPELSKGLQLWWAALGGSLIALGLFQVVRGALRRSSGTGVWGLLMMAGALAVLYFNIPPECQATIRSWVQGI